MYTRHPFSLRELVVYCYVSNLGVDFILWYLYEYSFIYDLRWQDPTKIVEDSGISTRWLNLHDSTLLKWLSLCLLYVFFLSDRHRMVKGHFHVCVKVHQSTRSLTPTVGFRLRDIAHSHNHWCTTWSVPDENEFDSPTPTCTAHQKTLDFCSG